MPVSTHAPTHDLTTRTVPLGSGRVEESELRFPSYTPLMLLLSLAYVVPAMAFGGRLLDTVGTSLSAWQLEAIGTWSQTLLGCALGLAFWGTCVLPWVEGSRLSWRGRWLALVTVGAVAMVASVGIHRGAAAWIMADPSGTRGRKAVELGLLAQAALESRIPVPELKISPELLASPAGKTYLSLLLVTEMTDDRNDRPTDEAMRQAMQTLAAQRVGTAAQVYDNIFVPSVRSLKDAYNAYVAAQTALVDDIRAITDQQNQAWNDYLDGLAKRGMTLGKLARGDWPAIVNDVRQAGVAVPTDWNPTDRTAFVTALSTQQRKLADTQYAERLNKLFGAELPPGLEWDQFHANPIVQARWRTAINAPENAVLSPTMGLRAFEEAVYQPMIDHVIQPKLQAILSPARAYGHGGPMAALGATASLRIALPAIAMVLVLVGVIWHGCGLAAYAARLVLPSWAGRRRCLALALGVLGLFVLGARNPVTRSDGFTQLQDQIADRAGPAWLAALGMVEAYNLAQPWSEDLRRIVLNRHDFGLDPFASPHNASQTALDKLLP